MVSQTSLSGVLSWLLLGLGLAACQADSPKVEDYLEATSGSGDSGSKGGQTSVSFDGTTAITGSGTLSTQNGEGSTGDDTSGADSGSSTDTTGEEIELPCPLNLSNDPLSSQVTPSVAYNPVDREYGVIYRSDSVLWFVRVDDMGRIVFGPQELSGTTLPAVLGGHLGPDLDYVASTDQWSVSYHQEGPDRPYVTLFDDSAQEISTVELLYGTDSEAQTVSYHPGMDRIITSNDFSQPWTTLIHQFDNTLSLQDTFDSTQSSGPAVTSGSLELLLGLGGAHRAIVQAYVQQGAQYHLILQLLDLDMGAGEWAVGESFAGVAGRAIAGVPINAARPFTSMAWAPDEGVLGVAYANIQTVGGHDDDVYLTTVDPLTGNVLTPTHVYLNAAAPSMAAAASPWIAWDGDEFLAIWRETSNAPDVFFEAYIGKFGVDADGDLITIGSGRFPLTHSGWSLNGSYSSLIGVDGIHVFAYGLQEVDGGDWEVFLCFEPPYV